MTKHIHGGDVYKHKDCLDFSANLNPLGTPESVKQAIIHSLDHIAQYPQVGCGVLRERIAESEGVKAEEVICGNGAAEVIFTLCHAVKPKRALIPAPAFRGTLPVNSNHSPYFCGIRTGSGQHWL